MFGTHVQAPTLRPSVPLLLKRSSAVAMPRRGTPLIRTSALAITPQYGYVMGSVATTALVAQWMAIQVSLARRKYGVAYPQMYAEGTGEDANKFNCTQRAHQNTLETLPMALACQMLLGLQHPLYAAGLGLAWSVGRIAYALGYSSGEPMKRSPGAALSGIVYLILVFSTLYAGVKLALGA